MILSHLQKLPMNVGDLSKLIFAKGFEWLPKYNKLPNLVTLVGRYNCTCVLLSENSLQVAVQF